MSARKLIVTADDFGRGIAYNEAVEDGHRNGVLTAASLMVGGVAFEDAVARARKLPELGVGLHLALVDAAPVLPSRHIPDLVGDNGRFTSNLAELGVRIFLSSKVQAQVAAEMRAQFERYLSTGLPLDHVDSHHHYHLHPTVFALLVPMAKEYGAKGLRIPYEPPLVSWRARRERLFGRVLNAAFHHGRALRMRKLARAHGLSVNDAMFGLYDSGNMNAPHLAAYIDGLPEGVSEVYCHPASRQIAEDYPMPPSYRPVDEYRALIDQAVIEKVRLHGVELTTFGRLAP